MSSNGVCYLRVGGFAEEGVESGEDLSDGVEVGAVGRQEEEPGAGGSDGAAHDFYLVAAEIVDDDDVAGFEGRHQDLFAEARKLSPQAPESSRGVLGTQTAKASKEFVF